MVHVIWIDGAYDMVAVQELEMVVSWGQPTPECLSGWCGRMALHGRVLPHAVGRTRPVPAG
jgi:hypothetical protein